MKNIIINLFMAMPFLTYAQSNNLNCISEPPSDAWENEFQQLISEYKSNRSQNKSSTTYTIPVIFHVIHGGEAIGTYPNLDSAQIYSQITVLNQDFNGNGKNTNTYPSNAFIDWAINQGLPAANLDSLGRVKIGNLDILFCPATKDTLGNLLPEPGIDRINYNTLGIGNPADILTQNDIKIYLDDTLKPMTFWDPKKYFNVWVTDKNTALSSGGLGTPPALSGIPDMASVTTTDATDGVWCFAKALGSADIYPSGTYAFPIASGRLMTHETGHWLGLRHIWGDANCGNDYCDDTPPAQSQNMGNPSYPLNVGTCSSPSNSPDGEMFMNFMDYTGEPYKYMFTVDQITRMQTALLNAPNRNLLGTHGLCSTVVTGINNENLQKNFIIYPNPTNGIVTIQNTETINTIEITTITGQVVVRKETTTNTSVTIDISDNPSGIYFIKILTSSDKIKVFKLIKN